MALRGSDRSDVDPVAERARSRGIRVHVHDDLLWLRLPLGGPDAVVGLDSLEAACREITTLAEGRRLSAELVFDAITDADMNAALNALAKPAKRYPRLWVSFWGSDLKQAREKARRFAESLADEAATVLGSSVLIDPARGRKRLAVLAYRRDASVRALDGTEVLVNGTYWMESPPPRKGTRAPHASVDADALESALRRDLRGVSEFRFEPAGRNPTRPIRTTFRTSTPSPALAVLNSTARNLGCSHYVSLDDIAPLAWAVQRLWQDVHAGGRQAR